MAAKTKSNIITLMEGLYEYPLPSLPRENEIWYYDLPKAEQYWKTPANKNFKWLNPKGELHNVKQMTERDRIEYIEYWRDKWENGLWMMQDGEPVHLTGMHIDHLIFNKFKNRNFIYLDAQRERFYFRDLTNKDPLCDGRCWAKGRRVGITSEEVTEAIRCLISDYANNINLQSDIEKKAKSTLLSPIIDAYMKRPTWMRENFYSSNGKVPRASLELTDVVIRDDDDYPLGGKVRAFPTTAKACDGEECMLDVMDELSKWTETDPYEAYEVNKKTIVNPGKRGKLDALSTTGDSQEAQKAVRGWHKLIADSNPRVRNGNGQTNSGLYIWFVSYIHSLELLERYPQIKDVCGRINRGMAEEIIWNEVKKHPKDSKEYVYSLYKMPMELRHTLLTPSGQSMFSKVRITARLEELRGLPNDRKPYVIGSLEYDQKGNVYFESNVEREIRCEQDGTTYVPGYWKFSQLPYFSIERKIDTRNRYTKSPNGVCFPPRNPEGAIGYDPIRYKKESTTSTNLSEAAIIAYQKFDYFGSGGADQYVALYLHRPDNPRDATKECIKACKFLGYPCMFERVIEHVPEEFEDANMTPFLLRNEKDGIPGMWIDSQGKTVKNATDWMVERFSLPQSPDQVDQIATHPFEETLVDLDGIDLGHTTDYDCYMALVELEHGLKQIKFTNVTDKTVNDMMKKINELIPTR